MKDNYFRVIIKGDLNYNRIGRSQLIETNSPNSINVFLVIPINSIDKHFWYNLFELELVSEEEYKIAND